MCVIGYVYVCKSCFRTVSHMVGDKPDGTDNVTALDHYDQPSHLKYGTSSYMQSHISFKCLLKC